MEGIGKDIVSGRVGFSSWKRTRESTGHPPTLPAVRNTSRPCLKPFILEF
jgi:hypothetical protein